jgi:hypothetical protein
MAEENLKSAIEQSPGSSSPPSSTDKCAVETTFSAPQSLDERERRKADDAAFDMSEDVRYYKPIDTYEGIHRWDPEFEWEEWEEKKVIRRV